MKAWKDVSQVVNVLNVWLYSFPQYHNMPRYNEYIYLNWNKLLLKNIWQILRTHDLNTEGVKSEAIAKMMSLGIIIANPVQFSKKQYIFFLLSFSTEC